MLLALLLRRVGPRCTGSPSAAHAVLALLLPRRGTSDFLFRDFNKTTGVVLHGAAATSSCIKVDPASLSETQKVYDGDRAATSAYSKRHGAAERNDAALPAVQSASAERVSLHTVEASDAAADADAKLRGQFATATPSARAPPQCASRVPPRPCPSPQVARHRTPQSVYSGFVSKFTFQVTDQSRSCTEVKDKDFGLSQHKSCAVHGGDGFAFVLRGVAPGGARMLVSPVRCGRRAPGARHWAG